MRRLENRTDMRQKPTKKLKEKANRLQKVIAQRWVMVSLYTWAFLHTTYFYAYADIGDDIGGSLTDISNRAIGALAAIIGISALISGAMSVKDMAEGSKASNPEQQEKGQKTLTAAIGMAVAAAVLLGIRTNITALITSAMGTTE